MFPYRLYGVWNIFVEFVYCVCMKWFESNEKLKIWMKTHGIKDSLQYSLGEIVISMGGITISMQIKVNFLHIFSSI